ncbi:hypothetical protein VM1G_06337 [Cytospora mali]|uniref:Uncharacterized protein n=1 Tax=Cytospora mali TaxID=578113 RepID=A0A194W3M9_CYTMA|nr:hypothetical protein VM1G_06337 [Valsa mali]
MHSTTISKSLLTLAALLAIAGSAPLPSATESAIKNTIHPDFVNRIPIVSTFPLDMDVADFDKTAQNTKRRTGSSESSSFEHTESSESSNSGSGTPGLVNKIEPLAAGFVGKHIADKLEDVFGSNSETTTAAAATETAASSQKERRKTTMNSGEGKSASSAAGDAMKLGKTFLGDTLMSGGSTLAGDYLANKVEAYAGSSTQAASSRKRGSDAGDEEEDSSVASDVWKFGKEFLKDTALNGGSTIAGDYLANKIEDSEAPTTTTASAQKRSTGLSDFDESQWSDLEHPFRIGTVDLPKDTIPEFTDTIPISIRAAKRKTSFGSTAKKFRTDAAEQGLSSYVGGWAAHKLEDEFGMNTAPTPTATASRKRSVAGTLAMKSGEKAAGKVVQDHTKNKTDSIESEFKTDTENMKKKLSEILSKVLGHHERNGPDSKMLRRSVDEAINDWIVSPYEESQDSQVQRRTSIPIEEPVESPSSSLEQRDPQGLFSLAKGMLKLADHNEPNTGGASENGNEVAEISTEIRKRSPEIGSDIL